jgi:hypothetical protein
MRGRLRRVQFVVWRGERFSKGGTHDLLFEDLLVS